LSAGSRGTFPLYHNCAALCQKSVNPEPTMEPNKDPTPGGDINVTNPKYPPTPAQQPRPCRHCHSPPVFREIHRTHSRIPAAMSTPILPHVTVIHIPSAAEPTAACAGVCNGLALCGSAFATPLRGSASGGVIYTTAGNDYISQRDSPNTGPLPNNQQNMLAIPIRPNKQRKTIVAEPTGSQTSNSQNSIATAIHSQTWMKNNASSAITRPSTSSSF
jgi:hypothetical protein